MRTRQEVEAKVRQIEQHIAAHTPEWEDTSRAAYEERLVALRWVLEPEKTWW